MAKFLETTGVSHHLQQLVDHANDILILISPYLKINDRLRYSLEDRNRMKIDIRIVYGKSELQPEQISWLRGMDFVRTSFCENLHAKCYLNESEAIITSMNLYEFSQVNNEEMGIHVTRADDPELYEEIYQSARRMVRISDEVRLSVEKVKRDDDEPKPKPKKSDNGNVNGKGHCIRCQKEIKLNPTSPYCYDCYKIWKKYENPAFQEKYCLVCGKEHQATMAKPVCYDCFKANRILFETTPAPK